MGHRWERVQVHRESTPDAADAVDLRDESFTRSGLIPINEYLNFLLVLQ
jgi:hypothetical protein